MPLVTLAYGRTGLPVDLPDDRTTVVAPAHHEPADDPAAVCVLPEGPQTIPFVTATAAA
jgi:hypothetical protein